MKVLNLQCTQGHAFEGWFGSEADFQSQLGRGLVCCPLCEDSRVQKMPSAPRLNLRAQGQGAPADATPQAPKALPNQGQSPGPAPMATQQQAELLQTWRQMVKQSEDVGERFAEEARAMHQGEVQARSIRGKTSPEEALALVQEGIEVMPLPDLDLLKQTLQ